MIGRPVPFRLVGDHIHIYVPEKLKCSPINPLIALKRMHVRILP
jgi:hypothetical protein